MKILELSTILISLAAFFFSNKHSITQTPNHDRIDGFGSCYVHFHHDDWNDFPIRIRNGGNDIQRI